MQLIDAGVWNEGFLGPNLFSKLKVEFPSDPDTCVLEGGNQVNIITLSKHLRLMCARVRVCAFV